MDLLNFNRIWLAGALTLFVVAGVAVPTLRLRRRAGITGYVAHQAPTPIHRLAVEGLRVVVIGLLAWVALYATRDPGALDLWNLPLPVTATGWVLTVAGLLGLVIAQTQMGLSWRVGIDTGRRTELVTDGLFARVRNPIFTGMLTTTLGIVAVTPSPWTMMGWLFLVYVLALQARLEESHLLSTHGSDYARYSARTGRFLPRIRRLSPQSPLASS
jgi:protein-S-isoprenylcysteine O-methyltransferase Ste14